MAINALGSIDVPLQIFGGLDTELAPSDLPEGVSPANQDVVYVPGSVQTRPALHNILINPFPQNPTYIKTYLQPNEEALNLFLDAAGGLWSEDVENTPGAKTLLAQFASGSYAQSATAFGREYIALSDGLHGTAVPLQFDGTNLDRVSQDGPGGGVSAADTNLSFVIATSPTGLHQFKGFAIATATESGNTVTVTLSGAAPLFNAISKGLQIGDNVQLSGISVAAYNGTWQILTLNANVITCFNPAAGLANAVGGTLNTGLTRVTATTDTGFIVGQPITIAGAGVTGYNGNWTVRGFDALPAGETNIFYAYLSVFNLADSGGGTLVQAGNISPGVHQAVVIFQTRSGYLTKPSPVTAWTAAGSLGVQVAGIPIGPANVVARIIAFTGAGGDNFFYIPADITVQNPAGGSPTIIKATVVADNTSSSATFNFDDNTLFAATAIDIPGRNLFALTVLSPCIGFFNFASRLFAWGEYNKVQNFLNMGFEGGAYSPNLTTPIGWTADVGALSAMQAGGAWANGMCWQIEGNGTGPVGTLTQRADVDQEGIAIILPRTLYRGRIWGKMIVSGPPAAVTGSVHIELEIPVAEGGSTIVAAVIPCSSFSATGNFAEAVFSGPTPISVPAGSLLRVYQTGLNNGYFIKLDEIEIIYDERPYFDNEFRGSYVINPESFDGVTGLLGPTSDATPLRCAFEYRDTFYFHTAAGLHYTTDNGTGEPGTWSVKEQSKKCGALSVHGTDAGEFGSGASAEDWNLTIARSGLYVFGGGDPVKISQENQPIWDRINWDAAHRAWIKNDTVARRAYIGLPLDDATAPNTILVMDYRELKTWENVQSADPIHISYTGKMISSDLTRKWTTWSLAMNCGELLQRPNGRVEFCLGAGNGVTPGAESGFGNVYFLDPNLFTDDDYGQITSPYSTYFFVNHEEEQALGVGSHRKLYVYLALFITGIGQVRVVPLVDNLQNPWEPTPFYDLAQQQNFDFEWGLNVSGERVAFRVEVVPLAGQTDNFYNIGKLIVTMRQDPWSPIRGAV